MEPKNEERKKYWEEMTTEEKVERLGDIVQSLSWEMARKNEKLEVVERMFDHHQHLISGEPALKTKDALVVLRNNPSNVLSRKEFKG